MNRAALAGLAGVAALAGCADLFGFKTLTEGNQDDASEPDVVTCEHVLWPGEPGSGSNAPPVSYDLAIRHVHLTQTPDGGAADFGFDLDHTCTTDLASSSCKPASPGQLITDGVGGVDNESIDLLNKITGQQQQATQVLTDDALNGLIDTGAFSILIRLIGLRSDQNQTSQQGLTVALQTAPHIVSAPPKWDGTDRWQVAASQTTGGLDGGTNYPATSAQLATALVNDGTIVATGEGPLTLTLVLPPGQLTGVLPITLEQVVMTGKLLKRADGNYDIPQGFIAGRWSAATALGAIANLSYDGGALCAGNNVLLYDFVKGQACIKRDINAEGFDDGTHACDGFSVVVEFDAVATTVSNIPAPDPVTSTPCDDASVCED